MKTSLYYSYFIGLIVLGLSVICNCVLAQSLDFEAGKTSSCQSLFTEFKVVQAPKTINQYSWDFGNGNSSKLAQPDATFTAAGRYDIQLSVIYSDNTRDTILKKAYINVFEQPDADFIAPKTIICPNEKLNLTSTSKLGDAPLSEVRWFVNGKTGQDADSIELSFKKAQKVSIGILIFDTNGCKSSLIRSNYIDVKPAPKAQIQSIDFDSCSLPSSISLKATTAGQNLSNIDWRIGNGFTANGANASLSLNQEGIFDLSLRVENNFGCAGSVKRAGFIKIDAIDAAFTIGNISSSCVPSEVEFQNQSTGNNLNYSWTFGDGNMSLSPNPSHTYISPGLYQPELKIENDIGCEDSFQLNSAIRLNPELQADFSADTQASCKPGLIVNFSPTPTTFSSYSWDFGDGSSSAQQSPNHQYNLYGNFEVILEVEDQQGCKKSISKNSYITIQKPEAKFTASETQGCAPLEPLFTSVSNSVEPITSWRWMRDSNSIPQADTNSHQESYIKEKKFYPRLIVETLGGCIDTSESLEMEVKLRPNAQFAVDRNIKCASEAVFSFFNFTNFGGVKANSFQWFFGDGNTSTEFSPNHTYPKNPGKYDITLVARNGVCVDRSVKPDEIEIKGPVSRFNHSFNPCSLDTLFLNANTIGGTRFEWYRSGSLFSTKQNTSLSVNAGESYSIALYVYDSISQCMDSLRRLIQIPDSFQTGFNSVKTDGCIPFRPVIENTANRPANHSWFINGKLSSQSQRFEPLLSSIDTFDIKLVSITGDGCKDSTEVKEYIHTYGLDAGFTVDSTGGCLPFKINLNDTSNRQHLITERRWTFGNGDAIINTKTPAYTYNQAPQNQNAGFLISLNLKDTGFCTSRATARVFPTQPTAKILADSTSLCDSMRYRFRPDPSSSLLASGFDFTFSVKGNFTNQRNLIYHFSREELIEIKLKVTDINSCVDSTTGSFYHKPQKLDISFDSVGFAADCPPLKAEFVAEVDEGYAPVKNYTWFFGDGNESNQKDAVHYYFEPGNYDVKLRVEDGNGCIKNFTRKNHVLLDGPYGKPLISDTASCIPLITKFSMDSTNASSIIWDLGNGESKNSANVQYTYYEPGEYQVFYTLIDSADCVVSNSFQHSLNVYSLPDFGWEVLNPVCLNNPFSITDYLLKNGDQLQWQVEGKSFGADTLTYASANPGMLNIQVEKTDSLACQNTFDTSIVVHQFDLIPFIGDTTICPESKLVLNTGLRNNGTSNNIEWHFGNDTLMGNNAEFSYPTDSVFQLSLFGNNEFGCRDSAISFAEIKIENDSIENLPDLIRVGWKEKQVEINISSNAISGFEAFRIQKLANNNFREVDATKLSSQTQFYDSQPLVDTMNCYYLETENYCGDVTDTSRAEIHCTVHLRAYILNDNIKLEWSDYVGWTEAVSYRVYKRKEGQPTFERIYVAAGNDYLDEDVECTGTYEYYIIAQGQFDEQKSKSNTVQVRASRNFRGPKPEILNVSVEEGQIELRPEVYSRTEVDSIEWSRLNESVFEVFNTTTDLDWIYDQNSNYKKEEQQYRLRLQDSCATWSHYSNPENSIHLKITQEPDGTPVLKWNQKSDWPTVDEYRIYKAEKGNELLLYKELEGSKWKFNDSIETGNGENPPCYQVEAFSLSAGLKSRSNIACAQLQSYLHIPNAFTPHNNDGLNDVFKVIGRQIYKYQIIITDRWGSIVYKSSDIKSAWDGSFRDKKVYGTFTYFIYAEGRDNKIYSDKGTVQILE